MTIDQLTLLEKGLTFIPTRKTLPIKNIIQTKDRLLRRIKLNCYFRDKPADETNPNKKLFVNKSNFTPPIEKLNCEIIPLINKINSETALIIEENKNRLKMAKENSDPNFGGTNEIFKLTEKTNLSHGECLAISELKQDPNLIIKPADKGGATVIMNKSSYIKEVHRQLYNSKYYKKLDRPTYHDNVKHIKSVLTEMLNQKYISNSQFIFLTGPRDYKARTFYLLPKIHKIRESWPWPDMPEGRPIVSDVDSETYRVSSFIDHYVNPLSVGHASYVKNSFDFVKKINNFKMKPGWLLVTGDVSALYTNMHFQRTINCVKDAFKNNPDPRRPDEGILKLLQISLTNNDFNFNGEFFLQILGTAMGKRFAPGLANLYLLELDKKATSGFPIKPLLFIRYLDDIFFIWPGTVETLKQFEAYLNNLIPDIKIKLEYSTKEIPFLDVMIYNKENTLQTKTFFKETDTHQLLHTQSFHPKHTFKGLIKSQFIRFKRLSSNSQNYNATCKTLIKYLKNRGYNQSNLRKSQYDVWHNYAHQPKEDNKNRNEVIPIIVDFCTIGTNLAMRYKNILANDPITENIKFITAFKNSKNLKQSLVRSKFLEEKEGGAFVGCSAARCLSCRLHAPPSKTCKISHNGVPFKIQGTITCDSKNVLYIITCDKCQKQYVGETGRNIRDRLNNHKSDIKNKKPTPVAVHFNQQGHSVFCLKITPVLIIENVFERKKKEIELQKLFRSHYPLGLNFTPVNKS